MRRLLVVFGVILAVMAGLLAIPVTHTAQRSRWVDAPRAAVWDQLDDLHRMDEWLPRRHAHVGASTFEGPPRGAGAVLRWRTKDAEHTLRLSRSSLERVDLEPSEAGGSPVAVSIELRPEGAGTRVTWSHAVTLRGWRKLVPLVRGVDSVVGPWLEENLTALAAAVEQPAAHRRAP